jgi:hypothetical protein
MRRGRHWYLPSVLVGTAVAVALSIAFWNAVWGIAIGAAVAILMLWEARLHR